MFGKKKKKEEPVEQELDMPSSITLGQEADTYTEEELRSKYGPPEVPQGYDNEEESEEEDLVPIATQNNASSYRKAPQVTQKAPQQVDSPSNEQIDYEIAQLLAKKARIEAEEKAEAERQNQLREQQRQSQPAQVSQENANALGVYLQQVEGRLIAIESRLFRSGL